MAKCKYDRFDKSLGKWQCYRGIMQACPYPWNLDPIDFRIPCDTKKPVKKCKSKAKTVTIGGWISSFYEGDKLQVDVIVGERPHKSFTHCKITYKLNGRKP